MSAPINKESTSHPSREAESPRKPTPQQKSSRTESGKVAAPQKSSSRAKAPVTSSAAVESTKITARKRAMPVDVSNVKLESVHVRLAKIKEQQDAVDAKKAKAAHKMKEGIEKKRQEAHEERQKKIARRRHHWDPRFDTSYVNAVPASDAAVIEPQRNSTAKKGAAKEQQPKKNKAKKLKTSSSSHVLTYSKKVKSSTPKQQQPNAESDSASTETSFTSRDASPSPVPASASGGFLAQFEHSMRQEIYASFDKLSPTETVDVMNIIMEYANMGNRELKLDDDNALGVDGIPRCDLIRVLIRIRGQLSNNAIQNAQVDPPQSEKSKPSVPADGVNKHGKISLDDDDDDQATPGNTGAHRRKKAPGSESLSSSHKESASATPSSTHNSVTVYSAAVNAVPAVPWGMIPFGADGHAAQKYHDFQEQLLNKELAKFEACEAAKQVKKRSASEELPEPVAKKFKPSDEERTLVLETLQASGQPMAEAKAFKEEDVIEKPEVASPAGDESIPSINTANAAIHTHGATIGEEAIAAETEPTTKEEAESTNDEDNKSSSSSAEDRPNDENKVAEETSKTDTAPANTSAPKYEHQDATQGDNKTSQTSDEEPAESSRNETAKSTSKTQDGQTSVNTTASTMTSGSATENTTQRQPAQKSKTNHAQDGVASVSKKPAKNSDNINTDDKVTSTTKKMTTKKPHVSGPDRFKPTPNKFSSDYQPQASTKGQKAFAKKLLADKTNTDRQPARSQSKKAPAPRTKEQRKATEKQPTQVKSAASRKRKHDEDDDVESNPKPAEKKQRKEQSKKRSREEIEDEHEDEDEDDDAGRPKKKTKKQRTDSSSTSTSTQPDADASTSFNPDRESRSRAAAKKRAADTTRPQAPRPRNEALWVDFDDEGQFKPRNEAQTQASGPVNKDEQTDEHEQKDKQTNGDDAEHGVKDGDTSSDARNTEDAPASNDNKPQPQKKKDSVAHAPGQEPKRTKKTARRQGNPAAQLKKVGRKFTMDQ
ncbi:hypothetical protein MBLNU13_g06725t1 [Cladosporium sp. NU13]